MQEHKLLPDLLQAMRTSLECEQGELQHAKIFTTATGEARTYLAIGAKELP